MKKFACVSGIAALLLLALLVTGWADANDKLKKAIREGNAYCASAKYEEALLSYESAMDAAPENGALHFNAAQAAYLLGDYEKTAQYYEKAVDCVDKYLHAGNAFYRMAEGAEDAMQQMRQYARAMQIYKEGILLYPQDLSLKYNYERAKEKLDALTEEQEQGQEQEGEGESQDSQESQAEDQESQGAENQENQEDQESQGAEDQEGENAESAQGEEDQSAEQDGEQEEAYAQEEGEEGETDPDQAAIERILAMLESREQEDLKNNREVISGKEGTNGW